MKRSRSERTITFPITYEDLTMHIKQYYLNYGPDPYTPLQTMILDRNTMIRLVCTQHENRAFQSRWRYLISDANKNNGRCPICVAQTNTRIKIASQIDQQMRCNKEHPATLIDPRFGPYDRILTKERVLVKCLLCGDEHRVSLNNFFFAGMHQCRECTRIKREQQGHPSALSIQTLNAQIALYGYRFLDIGKGVSRSIMTLRCPKGHQFTINRGEHLKLIKTLHQPSRVKEVCTICEDERRFHHSEEWLKGKGFALNGGIGKWRGIGGEYSYRCLHNPQHQRHGKLSAFVSTRECDQCKKERIKMNKFEDFKKIVNERGGEVQNDAVYRGSSAKIECTCGESHRFAISPDKLRQGRWCPECSKCLGERICTLAFSHIFGKTFNKVRLDGWVSPHSTSLLELDGYNPELKIAFEYQGKQHYEKNNHFDKSEEEFVKRLERDRHKLHYARKDGVTLVVVQEFKRYWSPEEILQRVAHDCTEAGLEVPSHPNTFDLASAYDGNSSRVKFERLIKEQGGEAGEYRGLDRHVRIKCANPDHNAFYMTPLMAIYHGGWCQQCKRDKDPNAARR